ncbi:MULTISPECIES: acyl carrier protein [Streptomyces]|uniref:Acyl carrier protein n=1 Tax=Streptomyces yanii TaxID=78510 RepID=A0ABV5R593_9ACTN
MWDVTFEKVLRASLRGLPDQVDLEADALLTRFGLDSLATVGLIAALEEAYTVVIPDEAVNPMNFRTPRTIWTVLSAARGEPTEAAG